MSVNDAVCLQTVVRCSSSTLCVAAKILSITGIIFIADGKSESVSHGTAMLCAAGALVCCAVCLIPCLGIFCTSFCLRQSHAERKEESTFNPQDFVMTVQTIDVVKVSEKKSPRKKRREKREAEYIPENFDACAECVVCMSQPKTIVLVPCNHLCICETCKQQMENGGKYKCPICRGVVDESMRIYT